MGSIHVENHTFKNISFIHTERLFTFDCFLKLLKSNPIKSNQMIWISKIEISLPITSWFAIYFWTLDYYHFTWWMFLHKDLMCSDLSGSLESFYIPTLRVNESMVMVGLNAITGTSHLFNLLQLVFFPWPILWLFDYQVTVIWFKNKRSLYNEYCGHY